MLDNYIRQTHFNHMCDPEDLIEIQRLLNDNIITAFEYQHYVSLLKDDRDENQNTISEVFHDRNIHNING